MNDTITGHEMETRTWRLDTINGTTSCLALMCGDKRIATVAGLKMPLRWMIKRLNDAKAHKHARA